MAGFGRAVAATAGAMEAVSGESRDLAASINCRLIDFPEQLISRGAGKKNGCMASRDERSSGGQSSFISR